MKQERVNVSLVSNKTINCILKLTLALIVGQSGAGQKAEDLLKVLGAISPLTAHHVAGHERNIVRAKS